jgi:hypothetical protein
MWESIRANPVIVATAIRATLLCAVAWGLKATADQIAATMLAVEAVLGLFTRQATTSNARLEQKVDERVAHREMIGTTGTGDGLVKPKV